MRMAAVLLALMVLASTCATAAPAVAPQAAPLVAASVNGEEISYDEYISALETLVVPTKDAVQKAAGGKALEQLIVAKLLLQLAEKEGVPVTDEQVDARVAQLKSQGTGIQSIIDSRYLTPIEFKRELKGQLAFVNLALKGANISDSEIADYYFKNKGKFNLPMRVKVAAVITPDKKKIEKAQQKLEDGADFGAVVKEFSEDAMTRKSDGVLGWVWPNQQGVPGSVANTAMTLTVGTISRPIVVQGQWVILKSLERETPKPKPLEEVKEEIRELLAVDQANRKPNLKAKIQEFRQSSTVQVYIKRFAKGIVISTDATPKQ